MEQRGPIQSTGCVASRRDGDGPTAEAERGGRRRVRWWKPTLRGGSTSQRREKSEAPGPAARTSSAEEARRRGTPQRSGRWRQSRAVNSECYYSSELFLFDWITPFWVGKSGLERLKVKIKPDLLPLLRICYSFCSEVMTYYAMLLHPVKYHCPFCFSRSGKERDNWIWLIGTVINNRGKL